MEQQKNGGATVSRVGIPPRVASIIWNRNFPSLLSDPSTQSIATHEAPIYWPRAVARNC
jgi:hypothetical protein